MSHRPLVPTMGVALAALAALAAAGADGAAYPRYGCGPGFDHFPFCDAKKPIDERVADLIGRLRPEEKPLLMVARLSPLGNVSRLGLPQYDWGANCVHGVQSRCGTGSDGKDRCPTSFPNPNHLGAAFNESAWWTMAHVIGVELRSLWRQGKGENNPPHELPPVGLDCWSPNINMVRDPRWGRNVETPSEDPFLLGRFGVQVTKGLQEGKEDKGRLQAIVTLKHFVANELEGTWPGPGGPAKYPGTGMCPGGKCNRYTINVNVSEYDLASSYMAPFRAAVVEGGALGVMCSYNAVNGYPSCVNKWLLDEKLRKQWGFQGYVTGDSGAVADVYNTHKWVPTMQEAVSAAVEAGTDVQSASWPKGQPWLTTNAEYLKYIPDLVKEGKLSEKAVDEALRHTLTLRFRLGLFDDPTNQPYEHVPRDIVHSDAHLAASMDVTEQGLVLLKNAGALPIRDGRVAVIGPHATTRRELLGNYFGQICPGLTKDDKETYDCVENMYEAIANLTKGALTAPGLASATAAVDEKLLAQAAEVAKSADHVVLALGLDTTSIEREGIDRHSITLPDGQLKLLDAIAAVGKPVTVVLINGGMVAMTPVKNKANAIVEAWYPGFFGARAVARALLGYTNRWGKLPVTIYDEQFTQQFDMLSWDLTKAPGRTYRYFTGEPLWPFGFGLSYTTFQLKLQGPQAVTVQQGGVGKVSVQVLNTGSMAGDEVVMAYFTPAEGTVPAGSRCSKLRKQLFDFQRIAVASNEHAVLTFQLSAERFKVFTDSGDGVSFAGKYSVVLSTGNAEVTLDVTIDGQGRRQPVVLEPWQVASAESRAVVV
ncbi:unnamed protein product [Effrenium voratum]|nr:unnamed protein product [Effrenium voratum]